MFTRRTFYRSNEWYRFREIVISKRLDNKGQIICEHCGRPIYEKYKVILHHKEELTEANVNDYNISLNEKNIMIVCFDCHNEIHNRFGSGEREVYIVHGSPCSGKSAFVETVIKRDDLVIDMDTIWKMINPHNQLHDKPQRLNAVVFKIRECMLEAVKYKLGKWQRAYIVTTECLPAQLDRMADMYNAKLIHIDTDKETCIKNLMSDESRYRFREDTLKYINDYWDKRPPGRF